MSLTIQDLRNSGANCVDTSSKFYNITQYVSYARYKDLNSSTKVTRLKYKDKIGYHLKGEIKMILKRTSGMVLVIANAGGGKTYTIMEVANELIVEDKKTAVVLVVPNVGQAIQNEVSEDLENFNFTKVIGMGKGERIEINAEKPLYSAVYDKALETVEELKAQGFRVVMVVDECHKLIKDTYREKALIELDKAMELSDLVVMMTATPRTNLNYYKYDEIFELEDEDIKNNLQLFRPIYTKNWSITLLREINKAIKKGCKPLIRLNSKKEIEAVMKKLEDAGISSAMLTSETRDSEIFKNIQETGMVGDTAQVLLCTSVVECGISLKATDIIPIEVIRDAIDFDKDNSIQFFARPRKQVKEGVMIIRQYDEDLDVDKKSMLELKSFKHYYKEVSEIVNGLLAYLNAQLKSNKARNFEFAKELLQAEMRNFNSNDTTINCIEADYDNLVLYINNKKLLQRVYSVMDSDIILKSPLLLKRVFKGSIFYNDVKIESDEIYKHTKDLIENGVKPKLTDSKEDKELLMVLKKRKITNRLSDIVCDIYDDTIDMDMVNILKSHRLYEFIELQVKSFNDINLLKNIRKDINDVKKLKDEEIRELLNDKNFLKVIPDIMNETIDVDNIKDYKLDIPLRDLIDMRDNKILKQVWNTSQVFNVKEAIFLAQYTYKDKNGNDKYLSVSDIKDMCEVKYFIEKEKDYVGYTKYDLIYKIIINRKTRVGNDGKKKLAQINLKDDLLIEIISELVKAKHYKNKQITKILNEMETERIIRDGVYDMYSPENIKRLDNAISSQLRNKVLRDIGNIFRLGEDSKGYVIINTPKKTFVLKNHLEV